MNNSIFTFPQKSLFHPQRNQQNKEFLNKKKPEGSLELWDKKRFLKGKTKRFSLLDKISPFQLNSVINLYTSPKTTKTNLNMIKSSSLGKK